MKIFSLIIIIAVFFIVASSMFFIVDVAVNYRGSNIKIIKKIVENNINSSRRQSPLVCESIQEFTAGKALCAVK